MEDPEHVKRLLMSVLSRQYILVIHFHFILFHLPN